MKFFSSSYMEENDDHVGDKVYKRAMSMSLDDLYLWQDNALADVGQVTEEFKNTASLELLLDARQCLRIALSINQALIDRTDR